MSLGDTLGLCYFVAAVAMAWRGWWLAAAFLLVNSWHTSFVVGGRLYDPAWYSEWMPRAALVAATGLLAAGEACARLTRQFSPLVRVSLRCSLAVLPFVAGWASWLYLLDRGSGPVDWFKALRLAVWISGTMGLVIATLFAALMGSMRRLWPSLPLLGLFAAHAVIAAMTPATRAEYDARELAFRLLALAACAAFALLPPYDLGGQTETPHFHASAAPMRGR